MVSEYSILRAQSRALVQHTSWTATRLWAAFVALPVALLCGHAVKAQTPADTAESEVRWWKGNLHTHSLWSDGDDYPEMITDWYRENGYHFLAFTEHNTLLEGERWQEVTERRGGGVALEKYVERFGSDWVKQRSRDGKNEVLLRPLEAFRGFFEKPDEFILIPAIEITDRFLTAPVHINVTNIRNLLAPQGGTNVVDVMQRNVDAVLEQRRRTGQPMIPHINHPNFGWAITAEELMQVRGERFFEVYNGHPAVHNDGDAQHAGTDRIWDIVLTWRLAFLGLEPMMGLAVDDGHNYHDMRVGNSNPGRGWVMVRSRELTAEALIAALEAGDFYGTSGVLLNTLDVSPERYFLEIDAEPGVEYVTEFIGTRRGFDPSNSPFLAPSGTPLRVTHQYSDEVGTVLKSVKGAVAEYVPDGTELYVRARVTSSKLKQNPYREGEVERAWAQPLVLPVKSSPAEGLLQSRRPLVIAHRGYSGIAPENTRAAFERALEARADLVELDYHHSKDGIPVVLHDYTLDRTTNARELWGGKGLHIAHQTWDALSQLEAGLWYHPPFPGLKLPKLEEAIEWIQRGSITLIERKAGDAATCAALLREREWINEVVVQSFDWQYLTDFHAQAPEQVLGALGPPGSWNGKRLSDSEKALSEMWIREVLATGSRLVVWNRQVDARSVAWAHQQGLRVWVYTINDTALAHELLDMGVDGIITDHPALLWQVLATRAQTRSEAARSPR